MRKLLITLFTALFFSATVFAADAPVISDTYDYDNIVTSIRGLQAPFVLGNYIVFTADASARNVGIAFDFENYNQIHAYSMRRTYDYEGEQTGAWYFYVMEKPKKLTSISYKLIIDGLWTTDPTNNNTIYDWENGIQLSKVDIPQQKEIYTESVNEGFTRFICKTLPGQKVRLGGNFTNWDSWIYEMTEIEPGKYEISLPLPAGTYYYAYYTGLKSFADETNPEKAYSSEGKIVSKIVIN